MTPSRPLPPDLRHAPFTVRDGRESGVSAKRLRAGDLVRPHHSVRDIRPATTLWTRVRQCEPVLLPGQVFSHVTAAALWGLPLPLGCETGPLHICAGEGRAPRRPGVVGHRARVVQGRFVGGVPVVEPLSAWTQCAEVLEVDDLVAMGDALAGRWSPHESARELGLEKLHQAVREWGSRRGARRLREALEQVRPNVWSPRETALRLVVVRAGIPEPPGLNAEVTDAANRVLGHGDLVWPEQRLVVEYEGDQHRTDRRQWRYDIAKYESYADAEWRVVRVTDDDLVSPGILVARITGLLARRALE